MTILSSCILNESCCRKGLSKLYATWRLIKKFVESMFTNPLVQINFFTIRGIVKGIHENIKSGKTCTSAS